MQVVLLRVGIDTGSGGKFTGPLFKNGSFEYVPIRDGFNGCGISDQTYGNTRGRYGKRTLLSYFPEKLRESRRDIPIHHDPEFETFTYGDPTSPQKQGLRRLEKGDLLVFYAGLQGWDFDCASGASILSAFLKQQSQGLRRISVSVIFRGCLDKTFTFDTPRFFASRKIDSFLLKAIRGATY